MTEFNDEFELKKPKKIEKEEFQAMFPHVSAVRQQFEAVFGPVSLLYANEGGREINTRLNRQHQSMTEIDVDQWHAIAAADDKNKKFIKAREKK